MRIFRIFSAHSLPAEQSSGYKAIQPFDEPSLFRHVRQVLFLFLLGISDRWRIERGVNVHRHLKFPKKPPASLAVFFRP
jgi:hypothetical protein